MIDVLEQQLNDIACGETRSVGFSVKDQHRGVRGYVIEIRRRAVEYGDKVYVITNILMKQKQNDKIIGVISLYPTLMSDYGILYVLDRGPAGDYVQSLLSELFEGLLNTEYLAGFNRRMYEKPMGKRFVLRFIENFDCLFDIQRLVAQGCPKNEAILEVSKGSGIGESCLWVWCSLFAPRPDEKAQINIQQEIERILSVDGEVCQSAVGRFYTKNIRINVHRRHIVCGSGRIEPFITIVIREEKTHSVLGYLMAGPELDFDGRSFGSAKLAYAVNTKNKRAADSMGGSLFQISQSKPFSFVERKRIQKIRYFCKEADILSVYPLAAECLKAIQEGKNLFWAVLSFCKEAQKIAPGLRPVSIIDYFLYSKRFCLLSALNLYVLTGDESLYRRVFAAARAEEGEKLDIDLLIDEASAILKEFGPQALDRDAFVGTIANAIQDFLWLTCPAAKQVFINSILRVFLMFGEEDAEKLKEMFRGCLEGEGLSAERLKQLGLCVFEGLTVDVSMEDGPAFSLTANAAANYFVLKGLYFPIVEFKILLYFIIEHGQDISKGPADETMGFEAWVCFLLELAFPLLKKAPAHRELYLRKTIDCFYIKSGENFSILNCPSQGGRPADLTWDELMGDEWGEKFLDFVRQRPSIDPEVIEIVRALLEYDPEDSSVEELFFSDEQKNLLEKLYREFTAQDERRLQSSPIRAYPSLRHYSSPIPAFGTKKFFSFAHRLHKISAAFDPKNSSKCSFSEVEEELTEFVETMFWLEKERCGFEVKTYFQQIIEKLRLTDAAVNNMDFEGFRQALNGRQNGTEALIYGFLCDLITRRLRYESSADFIDSAARKYTNCFGYALWFCALAVYLGLEADIIYCPGVKGFFKVKGGSVGFAYHFMPIVRIENHWRLLADVVNDLVVYAFYKDAISRIKTGFFWGEIKKDGVWFLAYLNSDILKTKKVDELHGLGKEGYLFDFHRLVCSHFCKIREKDSPAVYKKITSFKYKLYSRRPDFADFCLEWTDILHSSNNFSDELDFLKKAEEIDPCNFRILNRLCRCYFALNDFEKGLDYSRRCFNAIPGDKRLSEISSYIVDYFYSNIQTGFFDRNILAAQLEESEDIIVFGWDEDAITGLRILIINIGLSQRGAPEFLSSPLSGDDSGDDSDLFSSSLLDAEDLWRMLAEASFCRASQIVECLTTISPDEALEAFISLYRQDNDFAARLIRQVNDLALELLITSLCKYDDEEIYCILMKLLLEGLSGKYGSAPSGFSEFNGIFSRLTKKDAVGMGLPIINIAKARIEAHTIDPDSALDLSLYDYAIIPTFLDEVRGGLFLGGGRPNILGEKLKKPKAWFIRKNHKGEPVMVIARRGKPVHQTLIHQAIGLKSGFHEFLSLSYDAKEGRYLSSFSSMSTKELKMVLNYGGKKGAKMRLEIHGLFVVGAGRVYFCVETRVVVPSKYIGRPVRLYMFRSNGENVFFKGAEVYESFSGLVNNAMYGRLGKEDGVLHREILRGLYQIPSNQALTDFSLRKAKLVAVFFLLPDGSARLSREDSYIVSCLKTHENGYLKRTDIPIPLLFPYAKVRVRIEGGKWRCIMMMLGREYNAKKKRVFVDLNKDPMKQIRAQWYQPLQRTSVLVSEEIINGFLCKMLKGEDGRVFTTVYLVTIAGEILYFDRLSLRWLEKYRYCIVFKYLGNKENRLNKIRLAGRHYLPRNPYKFFVAVYNNGDPHPSYCYYCNEISPEYIKSLKERYMDHKGFLRRFMEEHSLAEYLWMINIVHAKRGQELLEACLREKNKAVEFARILERSIFDHFLPRIRKIISIYLMEKQMFRIKVEDLESYALHRVQKAIEGFDLARGVSLDTHIGNAAKYGAMDGVRDLSRRKKRDERINVINASSLVPEGSKYDFFDLVEDRSSSLSVSEGMDFDRFIQWLKIAFSELADGKRSLLWFYYSLGSTCKEIGQTLELAESTIIGRKNKILAELIMKVRKLSAGAFCMVAGNNTDDGIFDIRKALDGVLLHSPQILFPEPVSSMDSIVEPQAPILSDPGDSYYDSPEERTGPEFEFRGSSPLNQNTSILKPNELLGKIGFYSREPYFVTEVLRLGAWETPFVKGIEISLLPG